MKFFDRLVRWFFRNNIVVIISAAMMVQIYACGWYVVTFPRIQHPTTWGMLIFTAVPLMVGLIVFGLIYRLVVTRAIKCATELFRVKPQRIRSAMGGWDEEWVENMLRWAASDVEKGFKALNDGRGMSQDHFIQCRKEVKSIFWKRYRAAFRLGLRVKRDVSDYINN